MKKYLIPFSVIVAALLGAILFFRSSFVGSDSRNTTLVVGVENDLLNLDPGKIVDNFTLRVASQVCEGMVTLDNENHLVPHLVESWSSNADATEWRLTPRSGVNFHPHDCFGESKTRMMTADDIAYSLKRIVSKGSPSAFALVGIIDGASEYQSGETDDVSGVQIDGSIVVVRLVKPDPNFLYRLTSPWYAVVPKEAVQLGKNVFGLTTLIGTGPFRLVSRHDNRVEMVKNDHYWGERKGNTETLVFRVVKNEAIRLAELRGGKIDLMRLPDNLVNEVAENPPGPYDSAIQMTESFRNFTATVHPVFNSFFLGFNYDVVSKSLRRGVSKAIRRAEISTTVTGGLGTPSAGPIPLGLRGYTPGINYDNWESLEEARNELEGVDPQNSMLEILTHEKDSSGQVAELIQSQAAQAGITIKIIRLDYNGVIDRVLKGQAQSFMLSFEYVFSTPELILSGFFSPEAIPVPNLFGYTNEKFNSILTEFEASLDENSAKTNVQNAEGVIINDAPAAFLFHKRSAVIARKGISGVGVSGNNILPFKDVTIP